MRSSFRALILAAALGISTSASAAILDGGFEFPGSPDLTQYGSGSPIGAWTVTGDQSNAVLLLSKNYAETGISFNAHSGDYALDLTEREIPVLVTASIKISRRLWGSRTPSPSGWEMLRGMVQAILRFTHWPPPPI